MLCLLVVLAVGCQEGEAIRQGLELMAPTRPQPEATGTVTAVSAKALRAKQFVDIGKLEIQLGAYEAAVSAFEAALQLDPAYAEAKQGLEQARRAAAGQATTPVPLATATPTPFSLSVPPSILPSPAAEGTPVLTVPPTPTPTPVPVGCLGDEKVGFQPPAAAVGDQVTVTFISARNHANVRLAAPDPAELTGSAPGGAGNLWQWHTTVTTKGETSYYVYVDYNTLCAFGKLTVTGRWQPLSSGLPAPEAFRITAIGVSPSFPFDKTLFLGFDGQGVFKSTDSDAEVPSFRALSQGLTNPGVLSLALSPDYGRDATLFVGAREGFVFRSTNGGESWTRLTLPSGVRGDVTAVAVSPNFASDGTLFAGVDGSGILASPDRGGHWAFMNDGLADKVVQALAISADYAHDGIVFAGGRFGGAYRFGAGLPPRKATNLSPKFCLGSTSGGQPAATPAPTPGPGTPTPAPAQPTPTAVPEEKACLSITVTAENATTRESAADGQVLTLLKPSEVKYRYVVKYEEGTVGEIKDLKIEDEKGPIEVKNSVHCPTATPTPTPAAGAPAPIPTPAVDSLILGDSKTCFRTDWVAENQTWVVTARAMATLAKVEKELIASDDALVDAPAWSSLNTGLEDLWIRAFAISPYFANDRTVFAGSAFGGLFKHDGTSWKKVNDRLPEKWDWAYGLALSPRFPREPTVYVGTRSGVSRTSDGGETWVGMGSGLPDLAALADPNRGVRALSVSPDFGNDRIIFAGVWLNNIYRARD